MPSRTSKKQRQEPVADLADSYRSLSSTYATYTVEFADREPILPGSFDARYATTVVADMTEVLSVVHRIESKVDRTESKVDKLIEAQGLVSNRDKGCESEECLSVSDEEAEKMIREWMREHGKGWPQDISLALCLDFDQVMRVTRKMLDEGVLEDIDSE